MSAHDVKFLSYCRRSKHILKDTALPHALGSKRKHGPAPGFANSHNLERPVTGTGMPCRRGRVSSDLPENSRGHAGLPPSRLPPRRSTGAPQELTQDACNTDTLHSPLSRFPPPACGHSEHQPSTCRFKMEETASPAPFSSPSPKPVDAAS